MIIIFGPSGAGKSAQGQLLVDNLNYEWISTGAIMREAMNDPEIRNRMQQGDFVDDSTVQEIVAEAIKEAKDPSIVVLDGFPRNHNQAKWLLNFCEQEGIKIDCILHMVVDFEVTLERLQKRGRTDDVADVIKHRFNEYENVTYPILNYLDERGVEIIQIDASKTIDEVHEQIAETVKDVHQG